MSELSKERIEYIKQHVVYIPQQEYKYLVAIVNTWESGSVFVRYELPNEVLELLKKQLCYYKIGAFHVGSKTFKYAVLPTILGYEYIKKKKAPIKIELPNLAKPKEDEEELEVPIEDDNFYLELSSDTEERLSDYDEEDISDMRINTYMTKVMGTPGIKPHPKQLLLKEIADNLKVDKRMDAERFIIENKLQSRLGFVMSLRPCQIEIWCGKLLEYLKSRTI